MDDWKVMKIANLDCLKEAVNLRDYWRIWIWSYTVTGSHFDPVKEVYDGGKQSLTVYHHWNRVVTAQEVYFRCAMHADHGRKSVRSHIISI